MANQVRIGARVTVGPFAYLRPGTVLADDVHVGTFVEIKGSDVGVGSKVPHLSYVGDASIGEHSNIGAATVFVNYDGVAKHRSRVGNHARTGADNMFVAPVQVGDGAYTAAGSVITEDVRRGAMAVARARQRNVAGWVARNRAGTAAAEAPPQAAGANETADLVTDGRRGPMSTLQVAGRKSLVLLSGRAYPQLAEQIASEMGVTLMSTTARDFANGETFIKPDDSVRGTDAFVIQSFTTPINQWVMESLILVDALKRASAKRITVVMPFYPYARQDKKHRGREPISARLIADLYKTAGADRLMAIDLHTAQIQGFFDGPVDHLFALPLLARYVQNKYGSGDITVVSPDTGRVRVAEQWADELGGRPIAFVHKSRDPDVANKVVANRVVGDIAGRLCVLIDDMIDTGGSIVKAAELALRERRDGRDHCRHPRDLLRPGHGQPQEQPGQRGHRHQQSAYHRGQTVRQADRALDRPDPRASHPRGVRGWLGYEPVSGPKLRVSRAVIAFVRGSNSLSGKHVSWTGAGTHSVRYRPALPRPSSWPSSVPSTRPERSNPGRSAGSSATSA